MMLTATDQKPQKSQNSDITQRLIGNAMVGSITFL